MDAIDLSKERKPFAPGDRVFVENLPGVVDKMRWVRTRNSEYQMLEIVVLEVHDGFAGHPMLPRTVKKSANSVGRRASVPEHPVDRFVAGDWSMVKVPR